MIVVGVVILLIILGLGSALWLFTQSVNSSSADAATAEKYFDEARQRFGGVTPVLEVRDRHPVLARAVPAHATGPKLTTLRIIVWDEGDERFTRVDLPFWLLRLKRGPIEFADDADVFGDEHLNLTVEQLEKYGPTLVLDHTAPGGDHVLIWTE